MNRQDNLNFRMMQHRVIQLEDALSVVLLFYKGGPWSPSDRKRWHQVTGGEEATTKVMCDHIRTRLAHTEIPAEHAR